MPSLAAQTREQIRSRIGYNLMGPRFRRSTTTSGGGNPTSVIDTSLRGGNDNYNGRWIYMLGGDNDGEVRQASDYNDSATDITVYPGFSNNVATGITYEIWDQQFPPDWIESAINDAIIQTYGRAFDPVEVVSLHAGGNVSRFDIPSGISVISRIYYRRSISMVEVHACDKVFDQTTDADFTQTVDDEDWRRGGASLKLTVASAGSAGDVITDSLTAVDLSGMTHLEGWVKATTTLAAADYKIHLDSGTVLANGTDLESLNVPVYSTANVWQHFSIALGNPESDTAIISVGIEMDVDKGAHTVWFDDLKGVNNNTASWEPLHKRAWAADKEASDLILTDEARADVGYALLKLVGGDSPALLTADATVSEISAWWIVTTVTARTFMGAVGGRGSNEQYKSKAVYWELQAVQAYKGLNRMRRAKRVA